MICSPLNRLTSSKVQFVWTSQEQAAFDKLKTTFHAALSLFIPDWSEPFVIGTDASKIAVGSVLGQYDEMMGTVRLNPLVITPRPLTRRILRTGLLQSENCMAS